MFQRLICCFALATASLLISGGCQDAVSPDDEGGSDWNLDEEVPLENNVDGEPDGKPEPDVNPNSNTNDAPGVDDPDKEPVAPAPPEEVGQNPDDPNLSLPGFDVPPRSYCEIVTSDVSGEPLSKSFVEFDDDGRLLFSESDDARTDYFYNGWGGLEREVSSEGCVKTYSYREDRLLQELERACDGGLVDHERYTYDDAGRLLQACSELPDEDEDGGVRFSCMNYTYPSPLSRFEYYGDISPDNLFEEVHFFEDGRREKVVSQNAAFGGPDHARYYTYDDALRLTGLVSDKYSSSTFELRYNTQGGVARIYPWGTTTTPLEDFPSRHARDWSYVDIGYDRAGEVRRIDFFDVEGNAHGSSRLEGDGCARTPRGWLVFARLGGTQVYREQTVP